ncbi:hypothetical protein GCM10007176_04220 [Salinicoccus roseus]|nr:hypothetical protein GCM10007176_04220 [Salinicoccus roseus]
MTDVAHLVFYTAFLVPTARVAHLDLEAVMVLELDEGICQFSFAKPGSDFLDSRCQIIDPDPFRHTVALME